MDTWLKLLGPTTGALGLLVTVALALLGPGRFWGWRLQKVLDQVQGLDVDEKRFAAQRAVLLDQVDVLSSHVAAVHKVPTYWASYITAIIAYGTVTTLDWTFQPPELHGWWAFLYPFAKLVVLMFGGLTLGWAGFSFFETKAERKRFIDRGLPQSFEPPQRLSLHRFFLYCCAAQLERLRETMKALSPAVRSAS